jgi:hypothetical protein
VYSAPTTKNAMTVPTKIKSLTRSLLRLFTEPRVQPVHAENQNNADDDEFAHKTRLNHEPTLTTLLVKPLRKGIKKTLMQPRSGALHYLGKNKIDSSANTGSRIGSANFQI